MSLRYEAPVIDRRVNDGLVFDADGGRLSLGRGSISLAARGGNRAILEAYVDLVGSCRGERPGSITEIRDRDVDALTRALDLDASDLLSMIESVLGTTTDEAIGILSRLQAHRILAGVAAAAAAVVFTGGLAAAAAGGPAAPTHQPPTHQRPAPAVASAPSVSPSDEVGQPVVDGPLVETPDGVGLIPAMEVNADGSGLIPAETVEQDPTVEETPDGVGLIPAVQQDVDGLPHDPAHPG